MDYDTLLQFATELGYQLQLCGAEIYRIEESVRRVLSAYGASTGEVFAIPNCLIVSVNHPDGRPLTRIRRVGSHGTDIYRLEALNDLSRTICAQVPPLPEAIARLEAICQTQISYSFSFQLFCYFFATLAFCLFFGGTWLDALASGICGVVAGLCLIFLGRVGTNLIFKTFVGGLFSALTAFALSALGFGQNYDVIIIGALMSLVPGIAFTNAMRDIITGDMITGISKTAEAVFVGVFIALSTAAALWIARLLGVV